MSRSSLTELTERIQRISYCGMHVDLVSTSGGIVRIGSMPDIVKFLFEHGLREEIVVVPPWQVSLAGDNRTGEEFILWVAGKRNWPRKDYVGAENDVAHLEYRLDQIFPYFFDEKCLSVVNKGWLGSWFHNASSCSNYIKENLEIISTTSGVVITDEDQEIYNHQTIASGALADIEIENYLTTIPRTQRKQGYLEIIPVGCGNGFHGIVSNCLVRYGKDMIWIDPCGYPAHSLGRHGIHWDDVTHYLFTHNHEDHTQGLTACLYRARLKDQPMNLLAAESVFQVLKKSYSPLFPDMEKLVNVQYLQPGTSFHLGPVTIESRWNHHILPYGTIGLKFFAGGKCFGYSGDTKYDEDINKKLGRPDLMADWFSPCDLLFHEIDFDNPKSVHTHWKQVQSLDRSIAGKVLGYHAAYLEDAPFNLAREGCRYILSDTLQTIDPEI